MKLYHYPKAPHARKVQIFLHEKGLEIEQIEVNLVDKENLGNDYLKKNPRGVVPLLELDDGTYLDESLAICRYLESLYPDPALFGIDAVEKARIDSWERHMEFDGYIPGQDAFRNSVERFARHAIPGLQEEINAIPELAERGRRRIDIFFERLDQRLQEVPFIAGESFSMADITGIVAVDMAKRSKKYLPEKLAHAQRWYKVMYERSSIKSTYIES